MADESLNARLDEVTEAVDAAVKLAEDPEAFLAAFEAFRAEDAEAFQSVLARAGLLTHCHHICRWFCSKHCVLVCRKLAGPEATGDSDPKEVLEFTRAARVIGADRALLASLLRAVDESNAEEFEAILRRLDLDPRFWHQLCHWLCSVKCRVACRRLCPDLPSITK